MASCANAVKYFMAYNEFKLDGDYSINTFDPPFYLTPQYWKDKVEGIMLDSAAYIVTWSKETVMSKK
ncbi:MAG: hypothetical protein EZS28_020090 [Streblomastix strix]|uniref:Uncharacterized protein n=1 Tax=Streblomastix strix TaxID=222440 RepID=A0A5J4VQ13_9EUKA|nr:MAG: hypothetical protein EZS28_020090 [Streblomastix strix]